MKNLVKLKAISISILLSSCIDKQAPKKVFSHPEPVKEEVLDSGVKKIVIASTNNFNSEIKGETDTTLETAPIALGGADLIKNYIDTLKDTYKNKLLLVDAGHMLGRDDKDNQHIKTLKFYELLKYDAILLTENEMIEGKDLIKEGLPFVSTNIIDLNLQAPTELYGSKSYIIKEINGIKVAILGMTFFKDLIKKEDQIKGIIFDDPIARALTIKNEIKKNSDIVVALVHFQKGKKTNFKKLIKRFPPNFIDVVIGGDSNYTQKKINGIPIVQNYGHGRFISRIEVYYDKKNKLLLRDKTKIHMPTKVCSQFFSATDDCHIEKNNSKKIELIRESNFKKVTAKFLGKNIYPDPSIYKKLNTY